MAQPEAVAEDLLEHLPLHRADGAVDLGQGEVGAGVLAEDGKDPAVARGHLGLDPPVVEDRPELDHPALPLVAANLAPVLLGQAVGDPAEEQAAELPIGVLTALIGAPVFAALLRRARLGWA